MIVILCPRCLFAMRIIGKPEEVDMLVGSRSDYWPDKYTCPRCDGSARGVLEIEIDSKAMSKLDLVDLTPEEAFAALNGLGIPTEHKCFLEVVQALLKYPIKNVKGEDVPGTTRSVIHSIELVDGTKIYLGSSPLGAVVYRITPPFSYKEMTRE